MSDKGRILIVEDRPRERDALARLLRTEGYQTFSARNAAEARQRMNESVQLVICDIRLGQDNGVDVLRHWKQQRAGVPFVMVTAYGEVQSAVDAMKLGAEEYLTKPVNPEQLLLLIRRSLDARKFGGMSAAASNAHDGPVARILGGSPAMAEVRDRVRRAAKANSLVLILGESGTGKELVASAVHELSYRKGGPYIAINIAALPENLVEAELFGAVAGAFTGAVQDRLGRFEAANGGSLFIDEIGDFPLAAQAKLLRVLENLTVNPVGSNEDRRVDVRVITATSRNLQDLVARGKFREDLFYRLNVLTISLPPLRERREDLPELIAAFVDESLRKHRRPGIGLSPQLGDFLLNYEWPGNVRELRNMLENMIVMCAGDELRLQDLPDYVRSQPSSKPSYPSAGQNLEELERAAVGRALEKHRGNRTHAAQELGISVRTLQRKLKIWGLLAEDAAAADYVE